MAVTTYEGVVEKGKIRLKSGIQLPDNVVVYVVVPEENTTAKKRPARVLSPRLLRRKDALNFKMKVEKA